jgi:dephospho-CoA kinase
VLRVGLTGNVASGKSSVLDLFRQWGAAATDADLLAREAVAPGTPGLAAIARRFGREVLLPTGDLDREALRRRVMADDAERSALNAIVHPAVAVLMAEREDELRRQGRKIVVHDIPLLFEVLNPDDFDAIVLVDAPPALRRERLMLGRGLGAADADALIAAQQPADAKRPRSHFVIENTADRAALESQARAVWTRLQEQAGIA